ncbi:MAG: diacylglycerol/polyprenol kinase family protein [Candidatus Helarchaeota archaeon]
MNDFLILGIAYLYVVVVLLIGEFLRKKWNKSSEFTRKIIHIFAGFSVFTVLFFDHPWVANIVALSFVVLLYLAGPSSPVTALREIFGTMERKEEGAKLWGPFYYAISILVLTLIFTITALFIPGFELYYWLATGPLTIMYLGDGLAPILGKKYAKKIYIVIKGSRRSLIGSLTLFGAGFGGAIFATWFNGIFAIKINYGTPFILVTWDMIILFSLVAATIGTVLEFFSPAGLDNLIVPLGTTAILCLIFFF